MKTFQVTSEDKRFLRAMHVSPEEPPEAAPLLMQPEDWPRLVAQLKQDLEASERELRASKLAFEGLRLAYQGLDADIEGMREAAVVSSQAARIAHRQRRVALILAWVGGCMVMVMGLLEWMRP